MVRGVASEQDSNQAGIRVDRGGIMFKLQARIRTERDARAIIKLVR